ncbi:MAG: hypothetical protein WAK60_09775 [Sedimentisphaerales bacterium]
MKTGYGAILVLAIAAAVLSTTALHCRAAEDVNKEEYNIWSEDAAKFEQGRFELTEERIERVMHRLAETNPAKAEELKQLQDKDPEKFKVELREVMQEQFGKRFREHMEEQAKQHIRKHGEPFGHGGPPAGSCNTPPNPNMPGPGGMPPEADMQRLGEPFGHDRMLPGVGMHWRDRYLDWLKENYADEAEKLTELKGKDTDLYSKQLELSLKKYGRIAEASRENPQLAELLKKDLTLKQQQEKLLEEIGTAGDKEKEGLAKDLKEVINNRFDMIVERKQVEYEQLLKKLEGLKREVEQRKAKIEKWKDAKFKEESVKARLEELLSKSDKFTW